MKLNLYYTYELAEMFSTKRNIRQLLLDYTAKFYQMVHVESFDVRTISMEGLVPKGEPNKIVLSLEHGEYVDSAVKELVDNKNSASYQLLRAIRSFYAAFLAENGNVFSMVAQSEGFCTSIFSLAMYLYEYTKGNRDLDEYRIDCGDNFGGDLVFYVSFR